MLSWCDKISKLFLFGNLTFILNILELSSKFHAFIFFDCRFMALWVKFFGFDALCLARVAFIVIVCCCCHRIKLEFVLHTFALSYYNACINMSQIYKKFSLGKIAKYLLKRNKIGGPFEGCMDQVDKLTFW
jgi:hypothetical protein